MKNHHDILLPNYLLPFIKSSFYFDSTSKKSISGRDYIKNNIVIPVHEYLISGARLNQSQFKNFYTFFGARGGSLNSFNIIDPIDNKLENSILGIGGVNKGRYFKIIKKYQDDSNHFYKTLFSINRDSLIVLVNNSEVEFKFTLNHEIDIGEELIEESTLTVSCNYFIPVRFVTNKIEYKKMKDGSYELSDIVIREVISV